MIFGNKTLLGILGISLFIAGGLFWYIDQTYKETDRVVRAMLEVEIISVSHVKRPEVIITSTLPTEKTKEQVLAEKIVAQIESEAVVEKIPEATEVLDVVLHDVPFTSQAPFGDWDDPRQQDGCEEASLLMAHHWLLRERLSSQDALIDILALSDWELEAQGYYTDTSAEDTAQIMREYFNHDAVVVMDAPTTQAIKDALLGGSLVIAPMDGVALSNPYFNPPGPERHMVLVRGYDNITREFITNDPGTKRGEGYRYSYGVFMNAIADYPSGDKVAAIERPKKIIIIKPS